ncbi:MAG: ABC transporter substrate-binding protein [Ethanoligenens sp.]|uniref:ABC transporter substrate-binding protein n=1 Tax=Ethanoligenens sp. TaxID=2099655 RepID=UPI0039EAC35B
MDKTQTISALFEDSEVSDQLDFFGETVCALKPAFREGYNEAAAIFRQTQGRSMRGYLPAICGCDGIKGAENIHRVRENYHIDQMPAVISSFKLGSYFFSPFLTKCTGKGYFEQLNLPIHPVFEKSGLRDPNGEFHIFSVLPSVLLVDKKRLGDRPMPRLWSDLLDPMFAGEVALPSAHDAISPILPLAVLRDHGEEGLEKLRRSAHSMMHSQDMIRNAGNKVAGPTIFVVTWFFAQACPHPDVELVWPEDGALVEPSFLMVQKGQQDVYRPLIDFIAGKAFGEISAEHCYPAANPEVENHLPKNAVFNWLGWDFLRSAPLEDRITEIKARFADLNV